MSVCRRSRRIGDSADDSEMTGRGTGRPFRGRAPALPAMALTSDSSVVTAIANDYGYERVFARQVEALGEKGDVALGISTSGRSENVEAALAVARARGMVAIALTGRDVARWAPMRISISMSPETSTARVQEVHRTILHAMCQLIDRPALADAEA